MISKRLVKGEHSRRIRILLCFMLVIGACTSERVDLGPVVYSEATDPLGASYLFDSTGADVLGEHSRARVLVGGVETYQHVFDLGHQRNPRAVSASLTYPAGGQSWEVAVDSGSLSPEGQVEIVVIDGLLYQNSGSGWDADGFVGVALGLGPSPIVSASQSFLALPRSAFAEVDQLEIAGLPVTHWRSVDRDAIGQMWAAVVTASGSLAPALAANQIVPGTVDVFVTDDDAVVSFQYAFGAEVDGVILRVDGFAELRAIGTELNIAAPPT